MPTKAKKKDTTTLIRRRYEGHARHCGKIWPPAYSKPRVHERTGRPYHEQHHTCRKCGADFVQTSRNRI